MKNKEIILLKKKLEDLDIKVRFEKTGRNIIFYFFENQNSITISIKGIFWKKQNWLDYKMVKIEKTYYYNEKLDIKEIKTTLLCKLLEKGIKIFF